MNYTRLESQITHVRTVTEGDYPLGSPCKAGDVGHDLFVHIDESEMSIWEQALKRALDIETTFKIIWPWSSRTLRSGVRLAMPDFLWARIEARSSTSKKKLVVLGGIIDSGYRGEFFTILGNFSLTPRIVRHGERYAQVVFYPAVRPIIEYTDVLPLSERGHDGFGSTGK